MQEGWRVAYNCFEVAVGSDAFVDVYHTLCDIAESACPVGVKFAASGEIQSKLHDHRIDFEVFDLETFDCAIDLRFRKFF